MAEIKFFRTGHKYDTYGDFFRLVELAGFPIISLQQVDLQEPGVYIGSPHNGEWVHFENNPYPRRAHIILWNIERPSGDSGAVGIYGARNQELISMRQVDEVWMPDRRLADEAGWDSKGLRYVPLGSHPGLGEPSNEKKYGFVHMSYEVPRRQSIYKHFRKSEIGPNCWPPLRDEILKASKFALNVHQDQFPFSEPLRFALFAAYGLPILSETIYDAYPYGEETMMFDEYHSLPNRMRLLMEDYYEPYRQMGLRCRELMTTEFEFGKVVREAVTQGLKEKWEEWR